MDPWVPPGITQLFLPVVAKWVTRRRAVAVVWWLVERGRI